MAMATLIPKSKPQAKPGPPPRRGMIKVRIFKGLIGSAVAFASSLGGKRDGIGNSPSPIGSPATPETPSGSPATPETPSGYASDAHSDYS